MKRRLIPVLLLLLIAALPFVGNDVMKSVIKKQISVMESNGIAVANEEVDTGYLTTTRHYELILEDGEKLLDYISRHHRQQVPTYVKGILDGTKIGMDITYSNIPMLDNIEAGIYPTALSPELETLFRAEDPVLYSSLEKLLLNKTLYYEIVYDLGDDAFTGSIRDIRDAPVHFKDGTSAKVSLNGARFHGAGPLIAPNRVIGEIALLSAEINDDMEQISMQFEKIALDNRFESLTDYRSSMQCRQLDLTIKNYEKSSDITLKNMTLNGESSASGGKIESSSYGTVESALFSAPNETVKLSDIKVHILLNDLDRSAFESMQIALNRANRDPSSAQAQLEVVNSLTDLIAKGLFFNIQELSIGDITLNSDPAIGGFNHRAAITVKPDSAFRAKSRQHPMALMQNIDIDASLNFSKPFYTYLTSAVPQIALASGFAKDDGQHVRFEIILQNNQLMINGKALR